MLCPIRCTPGNEPRYSLSRRLDVLHSLSQCPGEKKILLGEISSEEVVDLLQVRLCKGNEMEVGDIAFCCSDLFLHENRQQRYFDNINVQYFLTLQCCHGLLLQSGISYWVTVG